MKYALAVAVLFLLCLVPMALTAEQPRPKFDQPAAPMPALAFDTDCDIECAWPAPGGGSPFVKYFDRCLFVSHYIYWPVNYVTSWPATLTPDELTWINTLETDWYVSQELMGQMTQSSVPNYCLHSTSCGTYTYFWPVAFGSGCGAGEMPVRISAADYTFIQGAANEMTCAQCFIRSLL